MNRTVSPRGFTAVRDENGTVSHADVGGKPLAGIYAAPPFKIEYSVCGGAPSDGDAWKFRFLRCTQEGNVTLSEYLSEDGAVRVTVRQCEEEGLYTQQVTAENLSDGTLCIKQLYNFFNGIDADALEGDYSRRARIGVVRSEWGAEGQLYWFSPHELGVIRPTRHKTGYAAELFSPTSLTTKRYMPLLFIRDVLSGKVWFFQHLPDGPYCTEIGLTDTEREEGSCFNVSFGAGTSERHGCRLYLKKGERYACAESIAGCAESFDGCIAALTRFRRKKLHPAGSAPLMFNDYMNCLWTQQNEDACRSLIEAAARAGAEGYCFDDGWYRDPGENGLTHLGDWTAASGRFGKGGLAGLISEIRAKGMVAGLWTELEVCSRLSDAYRTLPDECFLTNEGHRIFRSNRCYFNFGSEKARTYLMQRIASIYGMGVRYIKNDYNGHPGAGVDWPDASPAAGLEQHMRAVNAFYAEVRERFPDLYLENCSSGGMRADGNTNRNFHLQSVSDCEEFYKMPPLVCGAMLGLLPEQTGIWAYPYPRVFWDMNGEEYLTDAYREEQADGRNTAFNMINGMAGALYLSGKIDRADENNFRLIKEGVSLYKRLRPFLSEAVPFYPLPLRHIGEDTFHALGLRGGRRAVVAVWRTNAREDTVRIPLEGCTGVRVLYAARPAPSVRFAEGEAAVTFAAPYEAVLLEARFADR